MKVSRVGEFKLIEKIRRKVERRGPTSGMEGIIAGIGDDAAVVAPPHEKLLVVTTDTMVEGVHFDTEYAGFEKIGYKAMVSCISDIIAMGGNPSYGLVSLGLPRNRLSEDVEDLYEGMLKAGRKFGVRIVGGDTVSSPKSCVISLTLLGEVGENRVIYRSGAKVGDRILVTGNFGDSAAGLAILKGRWRIRNQSSYVKRCKIKVTMKHLLPEPRVKEAEIISRNRLATAMIDSSDGLDLSVGFICQASRVGARIWLDKVPISPSLKYLASPSGEEGAMRILTYALYGGEDYELVFTVPREKADRVLRHIPHTAMVGEIVPARWGVVYLDKRNREIKIKGRGYEHFKTSPDFWSPPEREG